VLILVWTAWAVACAVAMAALPGRETIPYHLGWAGFALAYGFRVWKRWQLVAALGGYTLLTGTLLIHSVAVEAIGWEEATEIPLMFLLALLMVWHAHRRQAALSQSAALAEREARASMDRERLMRLTSHELRTPLTIAMGYVELLQSRATDLEDQQDLAVTADELERLSRVSDRLLRMIGLQDGAVPRVVDVDDVLRQAVDRWRVVEDRRWVLDAEAGAALVAPERLRTCIDTLVENALRYTGSGDTIKVVAERRDAQIALAVHDSGVGLTAEQITAINAGELLPPMPSHGGVAMSRYGGTGLGLSIVREIAHARGGTLHAGRSAEGGAVLRVTMQVDVPAPVDGLPIPVITHDLGPVRGIAAATGGPLLES
jgi:signal transduction histidine kinase